MAVKEILLVDEKAPIISTIGFILQSKGHLVMLAPDAETAYEDLDNYYIDLILVYLTGDEKDKLDLLRRAKRNFSQSKVMVMANSKKMRLPIEAFQVEVDDYLFMPLSTQELCRRVDHCLGKNEVLKLEVNSADKADKINDRVLNALRLKFCDIHNTLFSLIAHLKIIVQENLDILDDSNLSQINKISHNLFQIKNITEEFLDHNMFCYNNKNNFENEIELVKYHIKICFQ